MCLWMLISLNRFEDVESKTFISRLSVERMWSSAFPQLPSSSAAPRPLRRRLRRKPTAAATGLRGKSRLRPNAAALCGRRRPRRRCGVFDLQRRRGGRQGRQWPGASIREAGARHRVSPTWGTSKSVSGGKFWEKVMHFSKCLGKLWLSTPKMYKKVWINDHNVTC